MSPKHRRKHSLSSITNPSDPRPPPSECQHDKSPSQSSIDENQQIFEEILKEKRGRMVQQCSLHSAFRDYAAFRGRSSLWLSIVGIPLFGILLYALMHYLLYFDLNKRVYNHVPGECSYLSNTDRGVVDVQIINNVTLLASTGTDINNVTNSTGAILLWRLDEHESRSFQLKDERGRVLSLNPYGLSFSMGTIVMVNLRRPIKSTDSVEMLRIEGESLKRTRRPVTSAMFTSLCDVVALDSQRFYATNSYRFRRSQLQIMEFTFKLNTGSLLYFDGKRVQKVLERLTASVCGLGIQLNELFVSIPASDQIQIYTIGKNPVDLKLKEVISVYSAPHFFQLGPSLNQFVVATHPNKAKHLLQKYWPYDYFAPSHVLRFQRTKRGNWRVTQFYANDGATISGATIAAHLPNNILVIGSVKDGLLKCALTSV